MVEMIKTIVGEMMNIDQWLHECPVQLAEIVLQLAGELQQHIQSLRLEWDKVKDDPINNQLEWMKKRRAKLELGRYPPLPKEIPPSSKVGQIYLRFANDMFSIRFPDGALAGVVVERHTRKVIKIVCEWTPETNKGRAGLLAKAARSSLMQAQHGHGRGRSTQKKEREKKLIELAELYKKEASKDRTYPLSQNAFLKKYRRGRQLLKEALELYEKVRPESAQGDS